jgi:hypothetical protein
MSVKCAFIKTDWNNPAPNYKDIDLNFGKSGRVLYGGDKRKSKNTPYLDKLHTISHGFQGFVKILFPNTKNDFRDQFELYLFDKDAHETMLYLKYPQTITHFIVDDNLIDYIHHLNWSYQHLVRYMRDLEGTTNSLNFFNEKSISDSKFERAFPAYVKANDKLKEAVISASQRIAEQAELIFKSGW